MEIDLQFFGGRGASAGDSESSGLTKEFKRLTKEREKVLEEHVKLRDRNNKIEREGGKVTAEQKKEFDNVWDKLMDYDNKIDNAANKVIRQAPDSVFDKAAGKFFDDIVRYENQKTADKIINKMTRTNKDGSLSATAKKVAADYAHSIGSDYARNAGVHFGTAFGYQKDQSNLNRAAEALLREAKKRKK